MEEMDQRQKARYIKGTILNAIVIVLLGVYIFGFVSSKYGDIGNMTSQINEIQSATQSLKDKGVDAKKFEDLLNRSGRKQELSTEVFSDKPKLEQALKKPDSFHGDYIAWISEENSKIDTINTEIAKNDKILGNIIPNYTNMALADNSSIITNQITLQSFIEYIEKDILAKYSLTSFSSL